MALLVTPFIWSVISDLTSSNSTLPSAGPSASNAQFARSAGRGQSRPANAPSGFPGGGGDRGSGVDSKLLSYLETNQGTTKFLFAVQSSMTADSYIIQTGKAVMAMGGFSGGDPILTTTSLAQLVKNNTIRYFLLSGGNGGGPGGFGQGSSLTTWVQNNCKVVPSSQWQTSTSTGGSSNFGFGGGGNDQLYDCATAR
jgi:4-amino-4-deoxy-L-arabinose transferase-like glycosyltransferase